MRRSRIVHEMPEVTRELARIGALDKRTMKHFDALMLPSVQHLSPKDIRALRERSRPLCQCELEHLPFGIYSPR